MKYNERIRVLRENIGKNQTEIEKILGIRETRAANKAPDKAMHILSSISRLDTGNKK